MDRRDKLTEAEFLAIWDKLSDADREWIEGIQDSLKRMDWEGIAQELHKLVEAKAKADETEADETEVGEYDYPVWPMDTEDMKRLLDEIDERTAAEYAEFTQITVNGIKEFLTVVAREMRTLYRPELERSYRWNLERGCINRAAQMLDENADADDRMTLLVFQVSLEKLFEEIEPKLPARAPKYPRYPRKMRRDDLFRPVAKTESSELQVPGS